MVGASAKEQVSRSREELWQTVLPIVVEDEDGSIAVVGTGFVIFANGRQAHLVTAGHVGNDIQKKDRPNSRSHPTTPSDFRAPEYRIDLRHVRPFAIYRHPKHGACRVSIDAWLELRNADLALCLIRFGDEIPSDIVFEKRFTLDTRPVTAGEPISALGYAKGKVQFVADGGNWTFQGRWRQVPGFVADNAPNFRLPGLTAAQFQCDVTFDHGMSGGPVCSGGLGGEIVVRGVVSSGVLASMIWQILLMPVNLPTPDGNIAGRTLLDLEREGVLVDRARGSDHVRVTRDPKGRVRSASWQ